MSYDLKPCPIPSCRGACELLWSEWDKPLTQPYWVECRVCAYQGPPCSSDAEAIALHNSIARGRWKRFEDELPTERQHIICGSPGVVTALMVPLPGTDLWQSAGDGENYSRIEWQRMATAGSNAWSTHWSYVDPPEPHGR